MPFTDPTKTRAIERRWQKEINRRWKRFRRVILAELRRVNREAKLVTNAETIAISATQARVYMAFVNQQINEILLGAPGALGWQAQHQVDSYMKSLDRFIKAIRLQGESVVATQLEREIAASLPAFTARDAFSVPVGVGTLPPIHQESLEFIFTRAYESLEGWTNKLSTEVRQSVFNGITQGQGVREVARNISERTSVSRSRAMLIAQTETNQAYGLSQTTSAIRSMELGSRAIKLRWLTKRDGIVRHLHALWHGTLSTPQEANRKKGVSPHNCRCGLAPVVEGANTEAKILQFKQERKELLALDEVKKAA